MKSKIIIATASMFLSLGISASNFGTDSNDSTVNLKPQYNALISEGYSDEQALDMTCYLAGAVMCATGYSPTLGALMAV